MSRIKPLALALSLIPLCLAAQESPFHGGQWAMQFGGSSNLFSLGVPRFTSAHSAWLLDLSNAANVITATGTDNVGTTTSANQQYINLDARLGRRFYQTGHPKVVSFQTLALEGGLSDPAFDLTGTHYRQTNTYAGINGELGGAYMLTRRQRWRYCEFLGRLSLLQAQRFLYQTAGARLLQRDSGSGCAGPVFLATVASAPPFDESPAAPGRSDHDEGDDG